MGKNAVGEMFVLLFREKLRMYGTPVTLNVSVNFHGVQSCVMLKKKIDQEGFHYWASQLRSLAHEWNEFGGLRQGNRCSSNHKSLILHGIVGRLWSATPGSVARIYW